MSEYMNGGLAFVEKSENQQPQILWLYFVKASLPFASPLWVSMIFEFLAIF